MRGGKEFATSNAVLGVNVYEDGAVMCDGSPLIREKGSNRSFIDFMVECPNGSLVAVEIDEFGHTSYPAECELARLDQLMHATKSLQTMLVVRINPNIVPDECEMSLEDKIKIMVQV